jgi:hypothetical protein
MPEEIWDKVDGSLGGALGLREATSGAALHRDEDVGGSSWLRDGRPSR